MTILEPNELSDFAPNVNLPESQAKAAIAIAQSAVEGFRGANRKLELTTYNKIFRLNINSQSLVIPEFPLVSVDSVRVRAGNTTNSFGRYLRIGEWQELGTDDYRLDSDRTIFLDFNSTSSYLFNGFGRNTDIYSEAKVEYQAGFDFSDQTNSEVSTIKYLLGQIIEYQVNNAINQGIVEENIDKDYRVRYASTSNPGRNRIGAGIGQVPDSMLDYFKKYKTASVLTFRG